MPLHWYRRPRMVVLSPENSVLEAARAIEENQIGAVVVQHRGSVVGIVTDRDLAVRALGRGLDATTTQLREVMTPSPLCLSPANSRADAIALMQERNIRRIPLVDNGRVVGIVTLDDLLLDEAAPLEELAVVVQGQLGEGGPALSERAPARRRGLARAEATLGRLLNELQAETELPNVEQVRTAVEVVLNALVRRLTSTEALDFIAQLPSLLQPSLQRLPPGPDRSITRASIESELASRLDLDPERAERIVAAVASRVVGNISAGEVEHMRSQLPQELRELLIPMSQPNA